MLAPLLPPGRHLDLPGRGTTFIRELEGPPGAPTVFLLHGLSGGADLNWFPAFDVLARHFRVVAIDHRGHGQGIRSKEPFRLEDCADDAVAVMDQLGIDRVIAVGYSMGGPIAQLMWHRHRRRVSGLVLCATSRNFRGHPRDRIMFTTVPIASLTARIPGFQLMRNAVESAILPRFAPDWLKRWTQVELRRHDAAALAQATQALGRYSSHSWIRAVDVPTSVIVCTDDQLVPPRRQEKLAQSIPGARRYAVDCDHFAITKEPEVFVPVLVDACLTVAGMAPVLRATSVAS
ncbi:MAG TPA: alpha/beta hydrolase [Acidimicrobiales bacterium]|jgi:3-oxoadipate enol-lactonase|nr:alpha/beta hydrolase [Acidimicrobiales bacterium]